MDPTSLTYINTVKYTSTTAAQDIKRMLLNAVIPAILVLLISTVFFMDKEFGLELYRYGLKPRTLTGLLGILTMPFIHGGFEHLFNNMTALFVLVWFLFYFYKDLGPRILFWIFILSGIWVWISARGTFHIGASAVVYGLVTFLFFSGIFRMYYRLVAVSLLVVFMYGSLVWGILPIQEGVSWEGHLWGSLAGLLLAFIYRSQGPQRPVYEWEEDDDHDDETSSSDPSENIHNTGQVTVHYHIKEK